MPRGRLRPAIASDLGALVGLVHDEEVRRYLCDDTCHAREIVAAMLARSEQLEANRLGLWVIEPIRECFAGIAGLQPVAADAGAAPEMAGGVEPIIALNPKYWGQGLACETLNALTLYSRGLLGLSRLVAAVDQPNVRSHRLMHRCGFTPMGRTPGAANELMMYKIPLMESKVPK